MGKYNGAVITTAGQNIIAESISGTLLEWTVMRSSSVAIPAGTNLEALTSLTGIEQSTHITDASVYGNNVLQVSARFSNTGVSTAYLIQTVGIYGQLTGGSETLIAVMTAVTPDEMPAYDPDSPSAFIFNTQITVTNADSVTMVVNDTGTATVADLNRKVDISGGDVSDTVVNTVVAESAEYPVPAAGDTVKVIIGKIAKFFADIVRPFTGATASASGAKGLVPAPAAGEQIAYLRGDGTWKAPVFSKTTTATGLSLDAREANPNVSGSLAADVKALNDSLNWLSSSVTPQRIVSENYSISNPTTLQQLAARSISASGLYVIEGRMNFLRTRPLVMKIMAVLNDGSEFLVANANYTAELETGAVLYATVLANPSETVGFRLYGKWASNETGCTALLSTVSFLRS